MSVLLDPRLIRQLAGVVLNFHPGSRGWRTILITSQGIAGYWTHIRAYLKDEGMPHGYRVEEDKGQPIRLCDEPTYPNLFVRWDNADLSQEVYDLLGDAEQRQVAWLMVEASPGSDTLSIYDKADGGLKPFMAQPPARRARPLSITIEGNRLVELTESLPFDIHVNSETPSASFSINIKSTSASFGRRSYHFTLVETGRRMLGAGTLRIDIRCRAGIADDIQVSCSGFASSVNILEQELGVVRKQPPRFSPGIVRLHVIFDRTTLDADAWPLALAALGGIVQESSDEMFSKEQTTLSSWNQQIRVALAEALARQAEGLHRGEVQFQLWWFADTPRDGIAPIKNIPSLRAAHGGGEHCLASGLRGQLCSPTFEYAPGFDLFDSVDEALQRVVNHIRPMSHNSDKQHAVLIVGDSPPPPADKNDVLWEMLVDGPPRTNARCSPHFRAALRSLQEMKIPVGWLFTKSGIPTSKAGYREYESQFQYYQSLRQRVLEALYQIQGLTVVEECWGVEDMPRALRTLLERMGRKDPTTNLLYFGDLVSS